jgi:hypothetical protein
MTGLQDSGNLLGRSGTQQQGGANRSRPHPVLIVLEINILTFTETSGTNNGLELIHQVCVDMESQNVLLFY